MIAKYSYLAINPTDAAIAIPIGIDADLVGVHLGLTFYAAGNSEVAYAYIASDALADKAQVPGASIFALLQIGHQETAAPVYGVYPSVNEYFPVQFRLESTSILYLNVAQSGNGFAEAHTILYLIERRRR